MQCIQVLEAVSGPALRAHFRVTANASPAIATWACRVPPDDADPRGDLTESAKMNQAKHPSPSE